MFLEVVPTVMIAKGAYPSEDTINYSFACVKSQDGGTYDVEAYIFKSW